MPEFYQQRICIKFFKLNKSASETCNMIEKASSNLALSRSRIFEWLAKCKGWIPAEDDERSDRPTACWSEEFIASFVINEWLFENWLIHLEY